MYTQKNVRTYKKILHACPSVETRMQYLYDSYPALGKRPTWLTLFTSLVKGS